MKRFLGFTLSEDAMHVTTSNCSSKVAFTLAEVLITLGVIGIVASMTIPTVVANYKKKEVETKLAKVYAVMNEAIKRSEIDNGEVKDWEVLPKNSNYQKQLEWYDKYLGKYIKTIKVENILSNTQPAITIFFIDGSILRCNNGDMQDFLFYINEKSLKNEVRGKNTFAFRFDPTGVYYNASKQHKGKAFEAYAWNWNGQLQTLYITSDGKELGCSQSGTYCTKLIQMNGWKIPKDYPIKF